MKKKHKPKKSLRTRKHTRAKMKRQREMEWKPSRYVTSFEERNPDIVQARQIRKAQETICHNELVHNRGVRKMMKKEHHESITARLKGWLESISKVRKHKRAAKVMDQALGLNDERKERIRS